MALTTITPAIESALIKAAGQARCERDQRSAVLVGHSPLDDPRVDAVHVVAHGWNGLPCGRACSLLLCSPGNKVGGCKATAEHAEAMALRHSALAGLSPQGMDMVHGKLVDGAIAVSRPPTEKACMRCAVAMHASGVSGIWLFVEGGFSEPLGQWTRWSVADYYDFASGVR